jgi:Skp family chaperone for outer membrane proteins
MLTKNDLQAIQQIVRTEVKEIIKTEVKEIIKTEVKQQIRAEIKPIHGELKKLRKDLNAVITTFDGDIMETKKRVDRIEDHLHLPPMQSN